MKWWVCANYCFYFIYIHEGYTIFILIFIQTWFKTTSNQWIRKQIACTSEQYTVCLIKERKLCLAYWKLKFVQMIFQNLVLNPQKTIHLLRKKSKFVNGLQGNIFWASQRKSAITEENWDDFKVRAAGTNGHD